MRDLVAQALVLASVVNLAVQVEFLRNEVFALSEILARVEIQVEGQCEAIGTISEDLAAIRADIAQTPRFATSSMTSTHRCPLWKIGPLVASCFRNFIGSSRFALMSLAKASLTVDPDSRSTALLLRAKPEVDAALADILKVPRSEPPILLAQDLLNDLWARRMQFLNPAAPPSP